MTRRRLAALLGSFGLIGVTKAMAQPQAKARLAEEATEHPRIARSIRELEETIVYLRKAPHDFGGHREDAIKASGEAIVQLRKALAYRVRRESRR